MNECAFHDAHEHRIQRSETDIQALYDDIKESENKNERGLLRVHGRIDALKTSIISAMFVVILQAVVLGVKLFAG